MVVKKLQSGLELNGVAPNILLQHVDITAPFIFKNEIDTTKNHREYLAKLIFYKKNLKQLKHINLSDYFYLCCAAHWATAGTFVPTNVDNQIREGLWVHPETLRHLDRMVKIVLDSINWDFTPVTNRKIFNSVTNEVLSTHEGTWLSVAIGAYCALKKYNREDLSELIIEAIIKEIRKEESLMLHLRSKRDHLNFLKASALLAHNLGDLDRVMDQWNLGDDDYLRKQVYKLGHKINENYSPVLAYAGQVNKKFCAVENHRHMSLRQPKCLRRSSKFLIPVGPFMDEWGKVLGESNQLTLNEKGEIVIALFDGYNRQNLAFSYIRAFRGIINSLPNNFNDLEPYISYDVFSAIKKSQFYFSAQIEVEEFNNQYREELEKFVCPVTSMRF